MQRIKCACCGKEFEAKEIKPKHRLLCGDSTKEEDVGRLMDGKRAISCITDPPYSVEYEKLEREPGRKTREKRGDVYKDPSAEDVLKFIAIIPSDVLVMTILINKHFHLLAEKTRGWELLYDCIWLKNHFTYIMGRRYQPKHEPILIFRRKNGKSIFNVPPNQSTVFEYDKPSASADHPTPKPIELINLLVSYHSDKGNLIYDPFLGSGTTLIACEKTGRICYGMEIEPRYIDVALRRWQNFTGKQAIREDGVTFGELEERIEKR